jgi:hypothetical protein
VGDGLRSPVAHPSSHELFFKARDRHLLQSGFRARRVRFSVASLLLSDERRKTCQGWRGQKDRFRLAARIATTGESVRAQTGACLLPHNVEIVLTDGFELTAGGPTAERQEIVMLLEECGGDLKCNALA